MRQLLADDAGITAARFEVSFVDLTSDVAASAVDARPPSVAPPAGARCRCGRRLGIP